MTRLRIARSSTSPAVWTYPPEQYAGDISSARVAYHTPSRPLPTTIDLTDVSTWTAATIDGVAVTTVAAASEGATSLTVPDASLFSEGRKYRLNLTDNPGQRNIIIDVSTITTTTLELAEPLPCAVPAESELYGWHISTVITTAHVDDAGPGFAVWSAVLDYGTDSRRIQWVTDFDIVSFHVGWTLDATRLTQLFPLIARLRSPRDETLSEVLEAGRVAVEHSLHEHGFRPELIRSFGELELLHATACVAHLVRQSPSAIDDRVYWDEHYRQTLKAALSSRVLWYAADNSLSPPAQDGPKPVLFSSVYR